MKVDGPKWGKWTVPKVDGPSKVDGPAESGRSWVKVDGLLMESGRSGKKWTVQTLKSGRSQGKVDGLPTKSGRSIRKWTVSKDSKWTVQKG